MKRMFLSVALMMVMAGSAWAQTAETPSAAAPAAAAKAREEKAGSGPVVDLHPKWTVGDVTVFEYELLSNSYARAADDEKKKSGQLYRQMGRLVRRVVAADEKGATLSLRYERLYLQTAVGTSVMYYDSEDGDAPTKVNELTGPVKMCMGREIVVRLDAEGEVQSVTGNESRGPGPDGKGGEKIPQSVLGDEMVKKMWRPLYRLDKPGLTAKVGETWTTHDESSDPVRGTFLISLHNELKSASGGVAIIAATADVEHHPATGPTAMRAELTEHTVKGEYEWDLVKGNLRSWTTSQEMKMHAERAGTKIVMGSKVTTKFQREDVAKERAAAARAAQDAENAKMPKATMGPDGKPVPVKP